MLKKTLTTLFAGATFLIAASAGAALTEGKDYKRMAMPQAVADASKLEVIEFFWYGCSHCYKIEPVMEAWAAKLPKDVVFRRVHVVWPGRGELEGHARIFAALQSMGLDEKHAMAVFHAVQRDNIELRKEKNLFDWVQKQGIDLNKFKTAYNAFSMNMQINKMAKMTADYRIEGVPAIIVNGKYLTGPSVHGREDGTVTQVIDEMLATERKNLKPAGKK